MRIGIVRFVLLCCTIYRGYACPLCFLLYMVAWVVSVAPRWGDLGDPAAWRSFPQSPYVLWIVMIRLGSRLLRNTAYASVLLCFLVNRAIPEYLVPRKMIKAIILTKLCRSQSCRSRSVQGIPELAVGIDLSYTKPETHSDEFMVSLRSTVSRIFPSHMMLRVFV